MFSTLMPVMLFFLLLMSGCKDAVSVESAPGAVALTQESASPPSPPLALSERPSPSQVDEPIQNSEPTEPIQQQEEPEPLPPVEVKNIGMHIGGGPNDRETKKPIADSVQPHFDALRACWKHVSEPEKTGDFGVDLLIPHEGGKATVSNPRSATKGEGFETCVLEVFESIDFKKPKTGKTMVSYSIRFTPNKE